MENILIEKQDNFAIVTINRPTKLNALNKATIEELHEAFTALNTDSSTKVIILTGSGEKAFVAGADISEFADFSAAEGAQLAAKGQELLFDFVQNLQTPVIAAVNGFALGGGCELAMACHFIIASESAVFGQPEVNLGIMVGYGGSQRLTQRVGKGRAMELVITGKTINATQAMNYGLVNYVVPQTELLDKAFSILRVSHEKAPLSVANSIKAVNAAWNEAENGYDIEAKLFGECFTTHDAKEGITAFIEKRKPEFKGN